MVDQLHAMMIPNMLIEPASKLNQEEGGTDLQLLLPVPGREDDDA